LEDEHPTVSTLLFNVEKNDVVTFRDMS